MILGTHDGFDGGQAPAPWFVDLVRRFAGEHPTLDYGCGSGRYAAFVPVCDGYDPHTGKADVRTLYSGKRDIPASAYDRIMSIEVIEHVLDVDEYLQSITRAAAPEAELLVTTPNIGWWKHRLRSIMGQPPAGEPPDTTPHIRHFTWPSLQRTLEKYGWNPMPPYTSLSRGSWAGFPGGSTLLKAGAWPELFSAGIIMHCKR